MNTLLATFWNIAKRIDPVQIKVPGNLENISNFPLLVSNNNQSFDVGLTALYN